MGWQERIIERPTVFLSCIPYALRRPPPGCRLPVGVRRPQDQSAQMLHSVASILTLAKSRNKQNMELSPVETNALVEVLSSTEIGVC